VPAGLKRAVELEYALSRKAAAATRIDLIVPWQLGGSAVIANLFPEPVVPRLGYSSKNMLETRLHDMVCQGRMTLDAARRGIAANWQALSSKLAATVAAPAPPPGGSGGTGLAAGLSPTTSLVSDGVTRYFKVYKPSSLNDAATPAGVPLVVWLAGSVGHGCRVYSSLASIIDCDLGTSATSGNGQIAASRWPAQADASGFILAFPFLAPSTCVNNGACGGPEDSPDAAFVRDVIDYVSKRANIDRSRIYVAGYSAGASQVAAISCGVSGASGAPFVFATDWSGAASLFAGFAVQAGALGGIAPTEAPAAGCHFPSRAIPTIYITSKGDHTITADPAQSRSCATTPAGTPCQLKAPTVAALYASHWGCPAPTTQMLPAGGGYGSIAVTSYSGCTSGGAFEWVSIGTSSGNAPAHLQVEYNAATDIPSLIWHYWTSH
jgi:poly(3-hydroxybutyrate) depolymerase